jgi:hypothetical protein
MNDRKTAFMRLRWPRAVAPWSTPARRYRRAQVNGRFAGRHHDASPLPEICVQLQLRSIGRGLGFAALAYFRQFSERVFLRTAFCRLHLPSTW